MFWNVRTHDKKSFNYLDYEMECIANLYSVIVIITRIHIWTVES